MKKSLSIILSLLIAFSLFSVSALAAEPSLEAEEIEQAAENVFAVYAGAGESAEVEIDENLAGYLGEEKVKAADLAETLGSIVLVADTPEAEKTVAEKIADGCVYTVTVTDGGVKTVYIAVDLAANPELFNLGVMQDAVKEMYENTKEITGGEEGYTLMDYYDIAGELALHMIVYSVLDPVSASLTGTFKGYYDSAKVADLNIDETRVPRFFITLIGRFIMEVFSIFTSLAG